MRLNEPSDGVILNGKGIRKQNRGYRSVSERITDKNPPKIRSRKGEHYIEDDKFLSGDQEVRGGSLFYVNKAPSKLFDLFFSRFCGNFNKDKKS